MSVATTGRDATQVLYEYSDYSTTKKTFGKPLVRHASTTLAGTQSVLHATWQCALIAAVRTISVKLVRNAADMNKRLL